MDSARRVFLSSFVSTAAMMGAILTFPRKTLAQSGQNPTQPPLHQNPLPPPDHPVMPPPLTSPSHAQLRQNERDIRKDVDELFSLAQDLKSLAGKSDASQELSVGLIQKTEQIEKLAKKIRDLARF